jgi:hypothetical protein
MLANLSTTTTPAPGNRHPPQTTFRQLVSRGWDPIEAANLTAYLSGLPIGRQPWTLTEVMNLVFLRELNRWGRLERGDPRTP